MNAVPTIAVFPEEKLTLDQKIEKWVYFYVQSLEENYHRSTQILLILLSLKWNLVESIGK